MTREQFEDIRKWQMETFPESTSFAKLNHLKEEIEEVENEISYNFESNESMKLEFADCFILLMGAAAEEGMDYDSIIEAISRKMEINKNREWGVADDKGVVNHLKGKRYEKIHNENTSNRP